MVFVDDYILFFTKRDELNNKKTPVPKGLLLIPNPDQPESANHICAPHLEPNAANPNNHTTSYNFVDFSV